MMKKVIKKVIEPENVLSCHCTDDRFYGVISDDCCTGFISRGNGKYKLIWAASVTRGNRPSSNCYESEIFRKLIVELIDANFEVFHFDTSKELYAWLSENSS